MDCLDIFEIMKTKKEAVSVIHDDCDFYLHSESLSNQYYFGALFTGEIKVSFLHL